ncbi:SIP5 [Candida pseudojiufengensis]|uniref:SIP5 n=1 Tax=Candida pseudojiufengensis TaxID=497109 RepID=UPI00222586A7|nr:SIP5 [Candida pseudojiufengensis]KAI5960373.1 SIP5 [Candida pseudojiufengensis]
MGNVPTKESRSRSNSAVSLNGNGSPLNSSSTITTNSINNRTSKSRRNTTTTSSSTSFQNNHGNNSHQRSNSSDLRKLKRQEEKDLKLTNHYNQLIVKFTETVDGGYLAPFGTYKSNLDYDCDIVRSLIINREISPFFTPLQDFNENWSNNELYIILNQLTLHALEEPLELNNDYEEDDLDNHKIHKSSNYYKRQEEKAKLKSLIQNVKDLQKQEETKFHEAKKARDQQQQSQQSVNNQQLSSNLQQSIKYLQSRDLQLKLYRNPIECPICFLYYPQHLNISRCCIQPICTECFVQIKRLDPHPPHDDPSIQQRGEQPHSLISEPASCPYCAMPDFGITYDPPIDIHTGIGGILPSDYKLSKTISEEEDEITEENAIIDDDEDITSSPSKRINSSTTSSPPPTMNNNLIINKVFGKSTTTSQKKPKRRSSIAANSPGVITIDKIRPDWEINLNNARNKLARKAATASAIHASNLIIENNNSTSNNILSSSNNRQLTGYSQVEQRMIEEAMRLSLIDEEERKRKLANE